MATVGGAPSGPALTPVVTRGRGPSGLIALGLTAVTLVAFVGISLVGQSDGRPDSQAALHGPNASASPSRSVTPAASLGPTARPTPPLGTPPPRVAVAVGPASTCPPGSTPDEPGPIAQARPLGVSGMAFDRHAGRLVVLAGAEGNAETWTFDVCTNTWTRMHPDRQPPPGSGPLVYDVGSDVTIAGGSPARLWVYDLEADAWSETSAAPVADLVPAPQFYDPVSGSVVVTGQEGAPDTGGPDLWRYDVETDSWTSILQLNRPPPEPRHVAYDASVDRMVAYVAGNGRGETWLFDLRSGTWSATGAETPQFSYGWIGFSGRPVMTYHEAAELTVMVGQSQVVAYSATADAWEAMLAPAAEPDPAECANRPDCRAGQQMAYDPLNERVVDYGGTVVTGCLPKELDDLWALDIATRSWTLVVSPSPVPPPLTDLAAQEVPTATGRDRSPWIRAGKVTLHGGPFFADLAGVLGEPSSSPPYAPAGSVTDGLLLPECRDWTEGTVWWEETTGGPSSRAWIEIDLGRAFVLDAVVVQADVNDEYRLSYRDPRTARWLPLWDVPFGEAGGMATRPRQGDASVRWPLDRPVTTGALRFEAIDGDALYSVSEIAVFGRPAR